MQYPYKFVPLSLCHPCLCGLHDLQDDPPAAWCVHCGMEVYEPRQILCAACREENENEEMLQ